MAISQVSRRARIFHGWYIVAVAFLAQFTTGGLQAYTLGVFMKPITEELGWTRGAISGVQTAGTVVNGLFAVFIGGILDRRGGRALMLFGAVLSGIGFVALSLMRDIWHFYFIRGMLIAIGNLCLGNLVANVAVSNWFIRKRGRALAIAAMGVPFGGVVLTPLSQMLIDGVGWRNAWVILGAMVWVVMIVPTALFIRRRPEDVGLRPDGDPSTGPDERKLSASQIAAMKADVEWTTAQAARTPALWMIMIAFGLAHMGLSALTIHIVPYVSDIGFTVAMAAGAQSVQGMSSMTTKLVWGLLLERFDIRVVSIASFICSAVGVVLLLEANSIELVYLSIVIFGAGMGGLGPIQEVVWANYFGRISLGAVRRIGAPMVMVFGAVGPLLAGLVYDATESYRVAFIALTGAYVVAGVLMLLLRPPRRPGLSSTKLHEALKENI